MGSCRDGPTLVRCVSQNMLVLSSVKINVTVHTEMSAKNEIEIIAQMTLPTIFYYDLSFCA